MVGRPAAERTLGLVTGRKWLVAVAAGVVGVVVAGVGGGGGGAAGAQEDVEPGDVVSVEAAPELLEEVSGALLDVGWYVEEGSGVPAGPTADVRASMLAAGREWGLVALTTPPARGTRNFTANLLAEVRSRGSGIDTVLVVTEEDVSGFSRTASDAEVGAALEAALPVFGADVAQGWAAVYAELVGEALVVEPAGGDDGIGVPLWLLGAGGLLAGAAAGGVAVVAHRRERMGTPP